MWLWQFLKIDNKMKFAALMDPSFHELLLYSKCKVVRIENGVQDGGIMQRVKKETNKQTPKG